MQNQDGVWLRLHQDSVDKWCTAGSPSSAADVMHHEAWALQYNQHLGKTLLVPVDEPKTLSDDVIKPDSFHGDATSAAATPRLPSSSSSRAAASSARRREAAAAVTTAGPGQYTVVKCGPSGHNIRSACSLKATAVGMLQYDAVIAATEDLVNADGVWVRLDDVSKDQYCHDQDGQSDNTCAFSCTFIWPVCAQMIVKSTIDRIVY